MAPPSPSPHFFAITFVMSPCVCVCCGVVCLALSSSRLSLVASRSSSGIFVLARGYLEGGAGPKAPRASDHPIDRPPALPTAVARARRSYMAISRVNEGAAVAG